MKKIGTILLCAMLVGCASAPTIRKVADVSPMGFVSITSNNDITWYGEKKESGGILGNIMEKAIDKKTGENAMNLLPAAELALREALKGRGVDVTPAQKIVESEIYTKAREDLLAKNSGMIVPSGYRFVGGKDVGLLKGLVSDTGMKSGLYVNFIFQKVMESGVQKNGSAKACVTMIATILNGEGKVLTQKSYYASSKETFAIVAGLYKPDALMALFPDAVSQVAAKFAADYEL